ncbi:MAG: DUF423 domain-containing protein [Bacteroidales bacterium]
MLAIAVAFGAFGAHILKNRLSGEMFEVFQTGVRYHFYHALGLLATGAISLKMPGRLLNLSALFLTAGILLFSGSLYTMALTDIRWLGAITPFGGLSFITGWVLLAVSALRINTGKQ